MKENITIRPLVTEELERFFAYLKDHVSDNGAEDTPLFLPIARGDLNLPTTIIDSFKNGQSTPINTLGWRRVQLALNEKEEIIGHIDLKSHQQHYTNHRAIMGMGVHRDHRKKALGRLLIQTMADWVKQSTAITYIDLWVLSENKTAIGLYHNMGFTQVGTIEDMFRIDGQSHDYLMMTKKI